MRWLAICGLLAACGDNEAAPGPPSPDAGPPVCEAQGGASMKLEHVADVPFPVALVSPDGDPRLFVISLEGRILIYDHDGTAHDGAFLDISNEVGIGYEQGLLSLAFHPDYRDNGRFYISYARDGDDALVVEEWTVSDDRDRADPSSRRVILEVPHTKNYHYGAHLAFGPDGMLYVAAGDGGPQRDPEGHGQNLASLRGKLLRIDVDHRDAGLAYRIPADNPFVATAGARPEIFAYGLRNPWQYWFDADLGDLYIGDVGYDSAEEVDRLPAETSGENFGWSVLEGASRCMNPPDCDATGMTPPIFQFAHSDGYCVVVLGPVYHGCAMPQRRGQVFLADFCTGSLWTAPVADLSPTSVTEETELEGLTALAAFGEDALGEVYLLYHDDNTIERIVPAGPDVPPDAGVPDASPVDAAPTSR